MEQSPEVEVIQPRSWKHDGGERTNGVRATVAVTRSGYCEGESFEGLCAAGRQAIARWLDKTR
jgi:hypothetical protein